MSTTILLAWPWAGSGR